MDGRSYAGEKSWKDNQRIVQTNIVFRPGTGTLSTPFTNIILVAEAALAEYDADQMKYLKSEPFPSTHACVKSVNRLQDDIV